MGEGKSNLKRGRPGSVDVCAQTPHARGQKLSQYNGQNSQFARELGTLEVNSFHGSMVKVHSSSGRLMLRRSHCTGTETRFT